MGGAQILQGGLYIVLYSLRNILLHLGFSSDIKGGEDKFHYLLLTNRQRRNRNLERWSDSAKAATPLLSSRVEAQTPICCLPGLREVAGGGIRLKTLRKKLWLWVTALGVWNFYSVRIGNHRSLWPKYMCKVMFLKISLVAGPGMDVYSSDKRKFF